MKERPQVCLCDSIENLADELMTDRVRLWQLPEALRALYFLGEYYGYESGLSVAYTRLEALESECDRLYQLATLGEQAKLNIPLAPTYAELCRIRGDHQLADQVEADWELLIRDKETSRLELIEQRRKETPGNPNLTKERV